MSLITTTLPQNTMPIVKATILDVLALLPQTLQWPVNAWVSGQLARYGLTVNTITLIVEQDDEPSTEMRQWFSDLIKPLGLQATVLNSYKHNGISALRLYNQGRLIVDKNGHYTELPSPMDVLPIITVQEVVAKLPATVPWTFTIWLVGGLVKNGFSSNDADMIVFGEEATNAQRAEVRNYFTKLFGWRCDVGHAVMEFRDTPTNPVCLFRLYENGTRCL